VLRVKSFEHSVAKLALEARTLTESGRAARRRRRPAEDIFLDRRGAPIPELEGTEAEKLYDINKLEEIHR
jgi:hypothetical protein